jgi:hypothetical protein
MQEIKLAFGRQADGRMVSIDAVARGLVCQCFCPQCETRLVAVKGDIRQHHFRHYSDSCQGAAESALHLFAKQIIQESRALGLPTPHPPVGRILSVTLESHFADCIPDVLLHYDTGETIAVEIWVAHQTERAKVRLYNDRQIGAVEIDLHKLVSAQKSEAEWRNVILIEAPRQWLSAPQAVWLERRADPRNHYCQHPGCHAWGAFGFGGKSLKKTAFHSAFQRKAQRKWFCGKHRAEGETQSHA